MNKKKNSILLSTLKVFAADVLKHHNVPAIMQNFNAAGSPFKVLSVFPVNVPSRSEQVLAIRPVNVIYKGKTAEFTIIQDCKENENVQE